MTDRARLQHGRTVRDARCEHASLCVFPARTRSVARRLLAALALSLTCAGASLPAGAQAARPWLDWRTVETEHFVLHYPERYREWTLALAHRIEGVRTQVHQVIGYVPDRRVHIVVDDPSSDVNGEAFTPLDAPTIVLWPTPPHPRDQIGNFRVWGELVATHEFAHIAHLTRPSRNRWQNMLWAISPVPLGPIAVEAPRWVIEGYATFVEGRVTGSGRPNHAWRAAVLRQFAVEGRLPSFGQLDATGTWESSNFAYLAGSAYIEWLARRQGDSSVTALWRRMTAKTSRSFGEAFVGVYGDGPAQLYGRFVAEITADALAFERTLARDALVPGTLVQRLARNTGDPAISPDGRFIALAVRRLEAPSELVVWRTDDEPDTLSERRRERQRARDAEDVPDRSFYPPAKRKIISLVANDGAPYESPRWLADNKRLLVTRRMPRSDGTIRPDLFIWSAEDGSLSRVTTGASVREADPAPDQRWAAGVRCDRGWCDLVRIDLGSGDVRLLVPGSPTRNYYRPRISKRTGDIVVAEQSGDRWRIARVSPENGALRYLDPNDGITRFDATFDVDGRTIIATSEAGGIANLERLDPDSLRTTRISSVTGAAVAADVAPDGTIWFLSLQTNGYDLRKLRPDSASIARASNSARPLHLALVDSLSPVLPPRNVIAAADSTRRPAVAPTSEEREYGRGPTRLRYLPSLTSGYGGSTVQLSLVRSDPVGRLGVAFMGSAGAGSLPTGLALELRSRRARTAVALNAWLSHEAPSRKFPEAFDLGLDLARVGGAARLEQLRVSDGGELFITGAVLGERQMPSTALLSATVRGAALAGFTVVRRLRDEETRYQDQLSVLGEVGVVEEGPYLRQRTSLAFGASAGARPLTTARVAFGSAGGGGALRERFAIGGFRSPLLDPMFDAKRVDAPAYPPGSAAAVSFASYRVAVPLSLGEFFYAAATPDLFKTSFRSYGIEIRERLAAIPALGTPDVDLLTGFARAVDAPAKGEWRYYVVFGLRP